jgi:glycosyltransferase involved in cell wall biosynthesis
MRCLDSILQQSTYPNQVVIHDDCSPNQIEIDAVVNEYAPQFLKKNIVFLYFKSRQNKGYDGSLRFLISNSTTKYVMFIGNDDILMPDCISKVSTAIKQKKCNMYSRNFYKVSGADCIVTGKSTFCDRDRIFSELNDSPALAFRLCCYFGGLVFDRSWADSLRTDRFDGSLYYQYYLSLNAFIGDGIFCISSPIVGALTDGIPLFNENDKSGVHLVGHYSPKARSKMWSDVMNITKFFDRANHRFFIKSIRKELKNRMAFHVMEMFSYSNRSTLIVLARELIKIGLFWSPVSVGLWVVNYIFQSRSILFYRFIRSRYQHT